ANFDNAAAGFVSLFPAKTIPGYPTTPAGTPGLGWVSGEVRQVGNLITWSLNGTLVAQFTNTTVFTNGDVMLGYFDVNGGSIGDTNNYAIFDNLRVEDLGVLVTVSPSIPNANEAGLIPGQFTLTRVGDTSGALTVNFGLTGTASEGIDYNAIGTTVTFAPGAATTNI